ncbi:MAG TPA: hypothetical protein VJ810_14875 [Blastocatellia bacterium]|nr:hypothetical protein [Blastocatellia bacterium]
MSEMIETNTSKALNHGNDSSPNYGEEIDPTLAGLPNTPAGHKIKSVTAELEKRRAELIALARAAEIRAREAEEKCEQIESRLEQEAVQRQEAEHRLKDLEEERLRQLQVAEIESVKTLNAALEQERSEVETRLNEAEERIKASENKAEELALALAEAERRRAEAEALAQVARDDAREIESLFAGAEARLKEVEVRLAEAESRLIESEARAAKEVEVRREAETALLEVRSRDEDSALAISKAEAATVALNEANQKWAEAEAAMQAVEDRRQQTEVRLTQELDQRTFLEQLLREMEEKSREQQRARETKELELYESLLSREELETRLKEAESRLMDAGAASVELTESNQKRAEAEAAARSLEEKARKIEALLIEAEAVAHEATERHKATEAKLQYEVKQRGLAEQKLKEFEDELSSYLELDWSKNEPDMSQAGAARDAQAGVARDAQAGAARDAHAGAAQDGFVTNEYTSQLLAQVEVERNSRHEAEEARQAIELRIWEMERELSDAEERHRQQEEELRELLRRQEAKQSALPEWATVPESKFSSHNMVKSGNESPTYSLSRQKGFGYELKFILYGIVITALLIVAGWLITEIFLRI